MTSIVASYDLGDALLTVLAIYLMVIWIWVLIAVLRDLFRDQSVSGAVKALWAFALIFVPFLMVFMYLIARGKGMRERAIAEQQEIKASGDAYIREAAGVSPADEVQKLAGLRDGGAISAAEFDSAKARALATA
jgi:hypothetical protein